MDADACGRSRGDEVAGQEGVARDEVERLGFGHAPVLASDHEPGPESAFGNLPKRSGSEESSAPCSAASSW